MLWFLFGVAFAVGVGLLAFGLLISAAWAEYLEIGDDE